MLPDNIQVASYRGAFFFVRSATTTGGRKTATKDFVNSDVKLVEDLGLRPRSFAVEGFVAARTAPGTGTVTPYEEVRDTLLRALEDAGPGELIHPYFGTITNAVCVSYNLRESNSQLGDSPISMQFEVSGTDGRPVARENVQGSVDNGVEATTTAINGDVAGRFDITAAFAGNFADAIAKGEAIVDAIDDAVQPIALAQDSLDTFTADLAEFSANIASLVAAPQSLADSLTNIFQTMNGVFQASAGALGAFIALFDFGDLDIDLDTTTTALIERDRNRGVLNAAVQGTALAFAYRNAIRTNFATVEDIDGISQQLEDQFQKLKASGDLNICVEDPLTALRIVVLAFFQAQRVTKPEIITVRTEPISARLLAFQYYGDSTDGVAIALLNGLEQSALTLEADIDIFSQTLGGGQVTQ